MIQLNEEQLRAFDAMMSGITEGLSRPKSRNPEIPITRRHFFRRKSAFHSPI